MTDGKMTLEFSWDPETTDTLRVQLAFEGMVADMRRQLQAKRGGVVDNFRAGSLFVIRAKGG